MLTCKPSPRENLAVNIKARMTCRSTMYVQDNIQKEETNACKLPLLLQNTTRGSITVIYNIQASNPRDLRKNKKLGGSINARGHLLMYSRTIAGGGGQGVRGS
eukprot:1139264-Pelagomonas_calceolata.AAC.7